MSEEKKQFFIVYDFGKEDSHVHSLVVYAKSLESLVTTEFPVGLFKDARILSIIMLEKTYDMCAEGSSQFEKNLREKVVDAVVSYEKQ